MPVGPKEVSDILQNFFSKEKISRIVNEIDNRLNNVEWILKNANDQEVNPKFSFTFGGALSSGDIKELVRLYSEAGWGEVYITNYTDGEDWCDNFNEDGEASKINITLVTKKINKDG